MNNVAIVSVIYHEPEWSETKECIEKCNVPVFYADRNGVGSLAMAYNRGFDQVEDLSKFKYLWFVSNIVFEEDALEKLVAGMDKSGYSAIHPSFDSDHQHIKPLYGITGMREVPYIEFTAPIVRSNVYNLFRLDEDMPYWGHDLDWSYRIKRKGCKVGVHYGVEVRHSYLRDNNGMHPATVQRKELRETTDGMTKQKLIHKYGKNWKSIIWTA